MVKITEAGMSSWKTTLAGIILAFAQVLAQNADPRIMVVGQVLTPFASFFLGASARDNNKTSEQVNAG